MTRPVAYVLKVFPRLSETFILNEILELERQGTAVRIFSLRPGEDALHADVGRVRGRVRYVPQASWRSGWQLLPAHLRLAVATPRAYLPYLWASLRKRRAASFRHFAQAGYVADAIRRENVAHLHAHFASMAGSVALHAHRLSGTPYSITAHAKDIYLDGIEPADIARKLRPASFAVTVSDFNVRHLTPISDGTRLVRLYNGLDLHRFTFAPVTPQRPPLVLAVGRLVEKKGFDDLVAACAGLVAGGREIDCRIVGSGAMEAELRRRIRALGVEDTVRLTGPMGRDDLIALFRRASVLVAPCVVADDGDRDGLPTVLIEAMALGVPVISTDVTGIPELVVDGRTGLLVPQKDPAALAGAIVQVLDDPAAAVRRALAARARVEECFDIVVNVGQLRRLFGAAA
ncbi:MAG: glycosyltransferase [Chloroflexi bacterium]|nr:glycosyltransferase [Chloroflexota bacterium]